MGNILRAIYNIADFHNNNLKHYATTYLNRINAAGEQLEFYIKDSVANSFQKSQAAKERGYQEIFSYLGNQNNPPDMVIRGGDAIEIKKMEGPRNSLALNSSYPKDMLRSSDTRILRECRACDGGKWGEKDLFYVVGYVKNGTIKHLSIIQGNCYAANKSVYEKLHSPLKNEIIKIISARSLDASKTVELGKIKRVDPLGITTLRIRGMWDIKNPLIVFSDIYSFNPQKEFSLMAVIRNEKYDFYPKADIKKIERSSNITISNKKIKDPNNPAKAIGVKLIEVNW